MRNKPLVLIVDDDFDSRRLLAILFAQIGFTTWQAENGKDALVLALARHPDLITTDLSRPNDNGFEFVQQVRSSAELNETPIIVISASLTEHDKKDLERCGPTSAMWKPFEPYELFAAVERFIAKERWQNR